MKLELVKKRHNSFKTFGYKSKYASYGFVSHLNKYRLELSGPLWRMDFPIYFSKRKPWVRSLVFWTIIWFIPAWVLTIIGTVVFLIFVLLVDFYWCTLFKRKWISEGSEIASGWISFVLSLIGAGYLISLLF